MLIWPFILPSKKAYIFCKWGMMLGRRLLTVYFSILSNSGVICFFSKFHTASFTYLFIYLTIETMWLLTVSSPPVMMFMRTCKKTLCAFVCQSSKSFEYLQIFVSMSLHFKRIYIVMLCINLLEHLQLCYIYSFTLFCLTIVILVICFSIRSLERLVIFS